MVTTPRYLLRNDNGRFSIVETAGLTYEYDIVSYTWGDEVEAYDCGRMCGIEGLDWPVKISPKKVEQFKDLMRREGIHFLWVDSLCINKTDSRHTVDALSKMYEYYKQAGKCYILLDMPVIFDLERITDDLKLLDHIQSITIGAMLIADSGKLPPRLEERRKCWAEKEPWLREEMSKPLVRTAGIDAGVMNCYNTCVHHVTSLFYNSYFTRVWTFQEMILGKNIELVGVNSSEMSLIGPLYRWMELAYDCRDKAAKLLGWINNGREVSNMSINYVSALVSDDSSMLDILQTVVRGIQAARTDIINGGQFWWRENQKGVSNIFAAISIMPRECKKMEDLFRGLLGIFSGMFNPDEIEEDIKGTDIDKMAFAFFKRLSSETGWAWTRIAVSPRDRGKWDWIPIMDQEHKPVVEVGDQIQQSEKPIVTSEITETSEEIGEDEGAIQVCRRRDSEVTVTEETTEKELTMVNDEQNKGSMNKIKTDIFAGVTQLGPMEDHRRAIAAGRTGLLGKPRTLMSIHLKEERSDFHFYFRGCNCGREMSKGLFRQGAEIASPPERPIDVAGDETGRALVKCATLLGCLLDPGSDVLAYKRRLLYRLLPEWNTTDPSARPPYWADRCVSGTVWAEPACPVILRPHNMAFNYRLPAVSHCRSRLARGSTAAISCELRVNCGCVIRAPFALLFEALGAVADSPLGPERATVQVDADNRITLRDGLGLVQIGDLGKTFNVVAFGGDTKFHTQHARRCLRTAENSVITLPGVTAVSPFPVTRPRGRVLIRSDFPLGFFHNLFRDYGYVDTGAGKLLVCRSYPLASYRIRGACIDGVIDQKQQNAGNGVRDVKIK